MRGFSGPRIRFGLSPEPSTGAFPRGRSSRSGRRRPLLKQREQSFPPLGFPRETDSLCPRCVSEVRAQILSGEVDWKVLIEGNPGEIKAQIVEEDGRILMKKDCPKHGHFEDVMSTDPAFFKRLEKMYPGRDFVIPKDGLHEHGTSSIKYGRGAVLTIDLTNRCNMMCNPCFMDANQVGYVHELEWDEVQKLLDDAASIKPRRQLSVQFSGGEPTLSPHFLPAIRYARKLGYFSVQCATNGIRFAQDEAFAKEAAEAGLRFAYLQFDGVGNEHNQHRKVGNLYDVKLPRDREPPQARHRRHPRRDDHQRRQQRPGRRHHQVRHREHRQGHRRRVPAGVLHRSRRGHRRRDPGEAALHALAPGARREGPGRHRRADARLVSALGLRPLLRPEGPARRPRVRVGLVQVRLPSQLRHRHDDARRGEDEEGRDRSLDPERRSAALRHPRDHGLGAQEDPGPLCRWRCRCCATSAPRASRRGCLP